MSRDDPASAPRLVQLERSLEGFNAAFELHEAQAAGKSHSSNGEGPGWGPGKQGGGKAGGHRCLRQ